ncbi:MarR family transcriptional regulator [Carnobacteriaceae bacterium zg-ZUI252]|nr:MarR family transcriptional regulator [Carnobacteriaceae bacterium zg-ZUI252]
MTTKRENKHPDFKNIIKQIDDFCKKEAIRLELDHLDGPQGEVVCYLFEQQSQVIYQKHIEEHLHIEKSVASRLIKRMEKNQFIRLEQHPTDKRKQCIRLSELGYQKYDRLKEFRNILHETVFANIDKKDLDCVVAVFKQISKNLQEEQHD